MKLRHDEIRKKYGKSNGLPISVGRGWPGLPGHIQCRAVSAVCGVALLIPMMTFSGSEFQAHLTGNQSMEKLRNFPKSAQWEGCRDGIGTWEV